MPEPPATENRLSLVERLLAVRPEERNLVWLVAVVFAGTPSTHALSLTTADTLFFARFGVENLPFMFMIVGVVTFAALVGYSAGLATLARSVFYPVLLASGSLLMVVLRLAVFADTAWVYPTVWVASNALVMVTLTLMWNLAGDLVDTRSAKRLFPLFASAGILGGIIGNVLTGPLTAALGAPNVLLVVAAILAATAVVARLVASRIVLRPTGNRPLADLRQALGIGFASPLLRLTGVGIIIASALFALVSFPFSVEVAEAFDTEAAIAGYLGLFAAAATTVTFLVSLLAVNRLLARIGIIMAWFVVALVYLGGFALWLVSLSLLTASIFRFAQWVAVNAVGMTARTAIFNVLRSERRAGVIAAYAAVPSQIGIVVAGLLLLVSRRFGSGLGIWLGLALAAVFAALLWRMRRLYAAALVDALRTGQAAAFTGSGLGVAGFEIAAEASETVLVGLESDTPAVRRMAVVMLGRSGLPGAESLLISRLQDVDVDVRLAALGGLEEIAQTTSGRQPDPSRVLAALFPDGGFGGGFEAAPLRTRTKAAEWLIAAREYRAAGDILTGLAESSDANARRAACQVVTATSWAPDTGMVLRLFRDDPSAAVRSAAAGAVGSTLGPVSELAESLTDRVPRVRIAAAEAWADCGGRSGVPMSILSDGPPWAWEAAITALRPDAEAVRSEVFDWAEGHIEDLANMAGRLAAVDRLAPDRSTMPALDYLGWLVREQLRAAHRVAVRVLGLLENEETVRLILSGLQSTDVEARSQALEAAESIGGSLGRVTVPVLESASPPTFTAHDVISRLTRHEERWIRVFALRALGELVAREWESVIQPATSDADELVRGTALRLAARMDPQMADALETMGLVERMLLLRTIPMFDSLLFDDLEELASATEERIFADGEQVFRRGDEGGAMLIMVSGEVEYRTDDGRPLARFERGQHLGELTALSGEPRAASAYAIGEGSALALDPASLSNLILDRPEVGRQMLASMASQLGAALRTMDDPEQGEL